MPQFLSYSCR